MRRAILPGLALLAAMPAAAGRGRWTIAGPPKAASLVVADPVRRGIVYASLGLPGQVWRSTDDGRSWTATGSPPADSIGLDPSDADVLYVGGLDVFRSSDRGGTWEEIVPDLTASDIRNIGVAPDDTNVLYVEAHTLAAEPGGQDAYRFARVRRESGGSWDWSVPDPDFTTHVTGLVADASSSGTIFASGVGGVYRSKDGGDSWTTLATGIPPDTWAEKPAIHSGAPSWLYVPIATTTLPAHGVAVSRDGGDTWTIETDGLPDGPLKCAA
ncbi:MAG TPA: hypothetical protein VG777_02480, partial [Thermoanaerobaculia bacterium]|nr:hypothetical protein [Thermoanaerobaculia bacterium]